MISPAERIDRISKNLDRVMDTIKKYDDLTLLEKELGSEIQTIKIDLNFLKMEVKGVSHALKNRS